MSREKSREVRDDDREDEEEDRRERHRRRKEKKERRKADELEKYFGQAKLLENLVEAGQDKQSGRTIIGPETVVIGADK